MSTLAGMLSTVPLATANILAYSMMLLVAIFLVFGPAVAYYYWKQNKKAKAFEPTGSPTEAA